MFSTHTNNNNNNNWIEGKKKKFETSQPFILPLPPKHKTKPNLDPTTPTPTLTTKNHKASATPTLSGYGPPDKKNHDNNSHQQPTITKPTTMNHHNKLKLTITNNMQQHWIEKIQI